jgi:hypothetical protein
MPVRSMLCLYVVARKSAIMRRMSVSDRLVSSKPGVSINVTHLLSNLKRVVSTLSVSGMEVSGIVKLGMGKLGVGVERTRIQSVADLHVVSAGGFVDEGGLSSAGYANDGDENVSFCHVEVCCVDDS